MRRPSFPSPDRAAATDAPRAGALRAGIAMPVALFAIVAIGALIAGAFFSSTQEFRIGRNSVFEPRALAVAEMALNGTLEALRAQPRVLAADGHYAASDQFTLTLRNRW